MSITLRDVSIEFAGRCILQGISVQFYEGVLTALVGPSGAGKTTLLGIISGIIQPTEGNVLVNDVPPTPAFVSWVPQGANSLPARTLLDNVMISPLSDGYSFAEARTIALAQISLVGLGGRESSFAYELSGGELQRLAIARAFASDRPLLIADEPTANLDTETAREIIELLRSIRIGRIMIIATHDPELMKAADKIIDLRSLDRRFQ